MRRGLIKVIEKFLRFAVVFAVIFSWIFGGWPQIFNFPPEVQRVEAAITHQRTPNEASIVSPVSINISVVYPDDLIYDGSIGSVGLTREPLLNMHWWGIAAYTETENFISECVSATSPLPSAVFNLRAGNYKIEISLAETKEGCEAYNSYNFSGNVYPLFAVLEAANFTAK